MGNSSHTIRAVLLAGGFGKRLRPLTEHTPKCLIQVGGRPMLDYWIDALEHVGVSKALVNTHYLSDSVRAYINQINATRKMTLTEAFEPELLGSAGTVTDNRDWADDADTVIVIYADNLSDLDLDALVKAHNGHAEPMTMVLFEPSTPKSAGSQF